MPKTVHCRFCVGEEIAALPWLPEIPHVVALSEGGVHVGYTLALVLGGSLTLVESPDDLSAVRGEEVIVVDDGCATPDAVVRLCRAARAAGASRVHFVGTWLPRSVKRQLMSEIHRVHLVLRNRPPGGVPRYQAPLAVTPLDQLLAAVERQHREVLLNGLPSYAEA